MPHRLIANQIAADPVLRDAKCSILETLQKHQQRIIGVCGPQTEQATDQADYDAILQQFADVRGGKLFYPYLGSGAGRGPLVELADGSIKYDMITGVGVHFFGHSHPALVEAGLNAAIGDTVMQGNLQQNVESFHLARTFKQIANRNGAKLDHCFLTTSGAMANENALKLAFAYKQPADRLLAFENCFMGRTMALAHITDRPNYRKGLPQTINVDYAPFFDHADPAASTQRSVSILKEHLQRYPGRHALMCLEMIQGEGGYYPGDRDFFLAIIKVLREHKVLVMVDEIQTFGRTTQPFAFQHFGLDEYVDLAAVGKMTQCCATLFSEALRPGPGLISQTFTGSTASIRAAQTILDLLMQGEYFGENGTIMRLHGHFVSRLKQLAKKHTGAVHGPFGCGAMIAWTPGDGSAEAAKKLINALYERGVIAFIAGGKPARVRMLPPFGAMTETDINAVCDILDQTLIDLAAGEN